jgi:hypothetical protein
MDELLASDCFAQWREERGAARCLGMVQSVRPSTKRLALLWESICIVSLCKHRHEPKTL